MNLRRSTCALLVSCCALTAADSQSSENWQSDIVSRMQSHNSHAPEVYSQALKVMEGLQTSPSCVRLAITNLVDTCQSLDSKSTLTISSKDSEVALEEVKSEFAARLAMCELSGAQASLPEDCMSMTPSEEACPRSRFSSLFSRQKPEELGKLCYPETTASNLKHCLSALDSRPQWWTSYSNARQNAVVICQASRDVIEKDNILDVYKSLTEVIATVTLEMQRSMQEHAAALEERQEYARFLQSMQEEATRAFQHGHREALSTFASYLTDMQGAFRTETERMSRTWSETEARVDQLSQLIRHSGSDLQRVHQDASANFQGVLNQVALHMDAQHMKMQHGYELAVATLNTLDETTSALTDVRNQMQYIEQSQDAMHRGFIRLEETFSNLTTRAEQLEAMLQGAAGTAQHIFSAITSYYWPVLVVLAVLIIRSPVSLIAIAIGLCIVYSKSFAMDLTADATKLHLPLITIITVPVLLIVGLLYVTIKRKLFYFGEGFILPSIEMPAPYEKPTKRFKSWLV